MAGQMYVDNNIVVVFEGALGLAVRSRTLAEKPAGCGVDVTYPTTSLDLFEAAMRRNGSCYILDRRGTPPRRLAFPGEMYHDSIKCFCNGSRTFARAP